MIDDGRIVATGEIGELELRNPAMMRGYYEMPEETAAVIVDGWLQTGDLVRDNGDGTYTFVGRKKEVIRRRGENLSPAEVEAALQRHPDVAEAAVIGVPSDLSEEDVKAFVVAAPGRTIDLDRSARARRRAAGALQGAALHRGRHRASAHRDRPARQASAPEGTQPGRDRLRGPDEERGSMKRGRTTRATLIVLMFAVGACGGGKKDSSSESSSTSTTVPDAATEAAAAPSLLLVQSDLPAGWKATPHQDDPGDAAIQKKLADCAGASDPSRSIANLDSPDFDLGDAEVSSSVDVVATRADFEKDVAALKSSKYVTCVKQLFGTELERQIQQEAPDATVDDVSLARVASPTYGDVTVALKGTVTLTVKGRTVVFYLSDYAFGRGRSEVDVNFFNIGRPFDPALEQSLLAKAVAKLKVAV